MKKAKKLSARKRALRRMFSRRRPRTQYHPCRCCKVTACHGKLTPPTGRRSFISWYRRYLRIHMSVHAASADPVFKPGYPYDKTVVLRQLWVALHLRPNLKKMGFSRDSMTEIKVQAP